MPLMDISKHIDPFIDANVSTKIFTIPNVISFIRLCLIPIAFTLLLKGEDLASGIIFGVAAATDFLDGQIARRTNTVTRLGQMLDPAVDRFLMIFGVIGLLIVGRLPLWIVLFVFIRDILLLAGGAFLKLSVDRRVPVVYPGKVATTFLFIGFCALIVNVPVCQGLGIVSASWLPGFSYGPYGWGIWFVYIGLVIALCTTVYYLKEGAYQFFDAKGKLPAGDQ